MSNAAPSSQHASQGTADLLAVATTSCAVAVSLVRAIAFWVAALLPLAIVGAVAVGVAGQNPGLVVSLLAVNVACAIVGHGHSP